MLFRKTTNLPKYNLRPEEMVPHLFENVKTVSFVNPVNYVISRKKLTCSIDTYLSDGIFSCAIFSLFTCKYIKRFSFDFTSLAHPFFEYCSKKNYKVFLVGAKEFEIKNFNKLMANEYPELNVCGVSDGYLRESNKKELLIKRIQDSCADVVICGMGCPLQELFIEEVNSKCSTVKLAITCGGFFHQFQNSKHYYPGWVNKLKLRMPYRFYKEPHTRGRLKFYPQFLLVSIFDFFSSKFKG